MKTTNASQSTILKKAERLGYSIEECFAFDGYYYIVDMSSHLVIAGARNFMKWNEVVQWVLDADVPPTLQ